MNQEGHLHIPKQIASFWLMQFLELYTDLVKHFKVERSTLKRTTVRCLYGIIVKWKRQQEYFS